MVRGDAKILDITNGRIESILWWFTYASKHALVGHDTDSEKVNRGRVVLATHHFGCHVAWCA